VLREQIVDSASALKQSLAGVQAGPVAQPAGSRIPVVGQAVLGFILPWILAMVAVPLETLISTGGHIVLSAGGALLGLGGTLSRLLAHAARYGVETLKHVFDIYIVLPLWLERLALASRGSATVSTLSHGPGPGSGSGSGEPRLRSEVRR
jgi:hypothetical protein